MVSYEEQKKNHDLKRFLKRSNPPSDEEAIEGIIMDNEGITIEDLKHQLKDRYGKLINKKNIEDKIITINRKYVEELGKQVIVYKNCKWWWQQ